MKKLLKSILIATASVGAVAGSTAAVVSCGSSSSKDDDVKRVVEVLGEDDGLLNIIDIDSTSMTKQEFANKVTPHFEEDMARALAFTSNIKTVQMTGITAPSTITVNKRVVQIKLVLTITFKDGTTVQKTDVPFNIYIDNNANVH